MIIVILVVSLILLFLISSYCILLNRQLHSITYQINRRIEKKTRQPIMIQLFSKQLNKLVLVVNKSFSQEEQMRIAIENEDKQFKELIANISHDLRTPLTAVKGYQQLLEKESLTEQGKKKLEVAMKHTVDLGNLVEHFFEYAYLINATPKCNYEKLNITNILMDCIVTAIPMLEEKGLAVNYEEGSACYIISDKEMVMRIINNLIRNCIQHSASDITVSLKKEDKVWIVFSNKVAAGDNLDVSQMFNRFYTSDQSRSKSTGLGLSIVQLLVEQLDGVAKANMNGDILTIQVGLDSHIRD